MAPEIGLISSGSAARRLIGSLAGMIESLRELGSAEGIELDVLLPLLVTRPKANTPTKAMEMYAIGNLMAALDEKIVLFIVEEDLVVYARATKKHASKKARKQTMNVCTA